MADVRRMCVICGCVYMQGLDYCPQCRSLAFTWVTPVKDGYEPYNPENERMKMNLPKIAQKSAGKVTINPLSRRIIHNLRQEHLADIESRMTAIQERIRESLTEQISAFMEKAMADHKTELLMLFSSAIGGLNQDLKVEIMVAKYLERFCKPDISVNFLPVARIDDDPDIEEEED